jgi:ABC-type transport system involved in multi-copper enzyme maturation permease subunit
MWQEFFRFDLRYQLRQPLLWIVAATLAALAFISAGSDSARIGGAIGNVHLNAPVVIANQLGYLSLIAMFMVTVFIAGAILRDGEAGVADLLFATPMRKLDYLLGRFLAGFGACLAVFAVITVAMMLGARLPSIDPERLGAFSLQPYAWAFCVLVVPNLLFVAALLMLLAALTRSLIMVYAGVLAFTVLWGMAGVLAGAASGDSLAVLLDPFGVRALAQTTRYFSSAQANSELPPLAGMLLLNRIIWSGLALCLFGATAARFKTQRAGTSAPRFLRLRTPKQADTPARAPASSVAAPRITPQLDTAALLVQWWQMLGFETRGVLRSLPFLIMLVLAVANFIANYTIGAMRFDSVPYPLTRLILDDLAGGMNSMLIIVLIFYSGELVFRDRQAKIADLADAMPVPDWIHLTAKAGALAAVIFSFLGAGVLAGIGIQLIKGGAPIEAGLYLEGTLINAVYFILMGLALLALHMIANNKYLGYLLGLGLLASDPLLSSLGLEHRLLRFAALPPLVYSDMNGYGHFLTGWRWFALYWMLFSNALLAVAQACRTRGRNAGWRTRACAVTHSLRGCAGAGLVLCLAAWAACGAWIWHNTNVLNRYESASAALDARADYEKRYRQYMAQPNPSLTKVRADVDIFPQQRRVAIRGHYEVRNKTALPLRSLRFQLDPRATTSLLALPPHTVTLDDRRLGFRIVELNEPLAPGASLGFDFTADVRNPGFTESGAPDSINHNGTMFTSEDYLPKLGYVQAREIDDRAERRKRGLGEPHRMPALDDAAAHGSNFWKLFGFDADLVDFDTTVSTSADQAAIASGTLDRSWVKDGRRYFHYTMNQQLPFFSWQSARWEVQKADWHGVPIEVYHDRKHPWNIGSMVKGAQRALDYDTANFGPYPHKQLRITEIPLYLSYARSFPATIPFSESLGFVSDLRGADQQGDKVDHVFYVTAHEVAHQWWGEQLIPANTQGAGMLVEALAEYSALMAVEKEFGPEKTRHILRFDLDQYFAGRAKELVEEQPLFKVESQTYVQYRKGSLVFYRLRAELGETVLNGVLREFLRQHRYQTAPYVTSRDLLAALRASAPADKQGLITDLFERIVFYDNRMAGASAVRRPDGKWDVTMQVRLAKLQADGKGKETARAYDEPVELAVFGSDANGGQRVLWQGKRRLPAGASTVTVTVDGKPLEAGVDPYNLLIDRVPGDNRRQVSLQ